MSERIADDRSGALDLIQAEAEVTEEYAAIVSDVLEASVHAPGFGTARSYESRLAAYC